MLTPLQDEEASLEKKAVHHARQASCCSEWERTVLDNVLKHVLSTILGQRSSSSRNYAKKSCVRDKSWPLPAGLRPLGLQNDHSIKTVPLNPSRSSRSL